MRTKKAPTKRSTASKADKATAVARQASQGAPKAKAPAGKPTAAKKRDTGQRRAKKAARKPAASKDSKKDQVLEMIRRPGGASLKEIMDVTGWQAHSVRGFVSGTLKKKMGLSVESFKRDDERAYRMK